MKHVLFPHEVRDDSPVGGKARALAQLAAADLPVPEWFAVLPSAFDAGDRLAPDAAGEIDQALAALDTGGDARFAVRSSAMQEDGARLSFAGQLESFLRVARADVMAKAQAVCASGRGERLASYRRSLRADELPGATAVIVQRMVDADASGVAFSADPVSGRRAVAVVAAVPGLASALVSGETGADTWHIDRDGRVVERRLEGVAAIDDATAVRVAALARAAERHFARPQDIEWSTAGDRLYLLQSRAVTTLAELADPDATRALWDNSNIVESYGGVTTPLTFSFARHAYENVYREFCRLVRVPDDAIEAHAATFACMLGLIRGRVYYNLYNWYRLVAVIPGYRLNRRFMEQMMGVRESLPEDLAREHGSLGAGAKVRDGWRLAVSLAAFVAHLAFLRRRVRRFQHRLDAALAGEVAQLAGLRPDELAARYREIERRLLAHWDAPIVNDFATMIFHGLLRRLATRWMPGEAALHNDLLCAEPGMTSEEPARRVREMAALAARDPRLVALLCDGAPPAVRKALRDAPDLDGAVRGYLERFGDRCMEELKLESATLHDDPTPLYRAVGQCAAGLAAGERGAPAGHDAGLRRQAEARMGDRLAWHPVRRAAFAWVLARARECVRTRENLRFERTRVFGRARRIVLEIGKRLAAVDRLAEPRDVFYLEIDEVLGFIEARATTADLKGLVAVRKAEFAAYRAGPAPADRFETRGPALVGHRFAATPPAPPARGEALQGLACCPGIVRGPVRIVRDARSAGVRRGEILVAERTDPGWVMVFPSAAGLLVERGSLLSHSAIVARELGLPAIVSLPGLTQWLRDGDWVEMDGATGTVVKVEAVDGPARAAAD